MCRENEWRNLGIEDKPTIFATPRFTFPYSLSVRNYKEVDTEKLSSLQPDTVVVLDVHVKIRTEFFGAILFKGVQYEETDYGYITYVNRLGALIIHYCNGKNTLEDISKLLIKEAGVDIEFLELAGYIAKLMSSVKILREIPAIELQENIYLPSAEVWKNNSERLTAPLRLYLNITKRCNLNCKHCYAEAERMKMKDIPREAIDRLLSEAKELLIPTIILIGGEPLLYEDFGGVIRQANQNDLSVFIATNGMLIDERRAEQLKSDGMKVISVSIDGSTEEEHDFIRGKGAYKKALEGIKNCIKAGIKTTISTTITSQNIENIPMLLDFWMKENVYDFQFMVFSPVGRGSKENELVSSDEAIIHFKDVLAEYQSKNPGLHINCTGTMIPSVLREFGQKLDGNSIAKYIYTGCEAARFRCDVSFSGDIVPCILLDKEEFRPGNIYQHTVKEIWDSPVFVKMGKNRSLEKCDKCKSCDGYEYCLGGCRGVIYSYFDGDLSNSYPSCLLRK